MRQKKKSVRTLTTEKRVQLGKLVDVLYDFLPLSSYSKNTITFTTIFAESSVERYLGGEQNKRSALEKAWTNVYRYHERLPKILIRKIVPASIDYRMHQRRPLTRAELQNLSDILFSLGIDMRDELEAVDINETLPGITVPPKELEERLRKHDLDPSVFEDPLQLFSDGHFNEAVRKAGEIFEDRVQGLSGISSSGRDLMAKAFADGTWINIDLIQPENQSGFIDGYRFLTMGAMASIRNIFSHGDEEARTPEECFEMLLFINWLLRCLKPLE